MLTPCQDSETSDMRNRAAGPILIKTVFGIAETIPVNQLGTFCLPESVALTQTRCVTPFKTGDYTPIITVECRVLLAPDPLETVIYPGIPSFPV